MQSCHSNIALCLVVGNGNFSFGEEAQGARSVLLQAHCEVLPDAKSFRAAPGPRQGRLRIAECDGLVEGLMGANFSERKSG